jgi:hypothetical protein
MCTQYFVAPPSFPVYPIKAEARCIPVDMIELHQRLVHATFSTSIGSCNSAVPLKNTLHILIYGGRSQT